MEKTIFNTEGNDVRIGVYFTKVDRENRVVSGFATLDNVDDHGDIIAAEGSRNAFARFRGGIREMHQPKAVGTLIKFEEIKKFDRQSGKVYDGIHVDAKVSKGAPDTWEKVLDGTLKGFSIGGKAKRRATVIDEDGNERKVIEDYDLIELSLVDNPANPLARVLTVRKVGDDYVYPEEDVLSKEMMHILLHEDSGEVILSESEEREGFVNIGWTDSPDNVDKINYVLNSYEHGKTEKSMDEHSDLLKEAGGDSIIEDLHTNNEGGATVEENENTEVEKSADVETEAVESVEEVEAEEVVDAEEEVEKAADVSEVEDEPVVEKSADDDDIVTKVTDAVEKALASASQVAKESNDALSAATTSFDKALGDFEAKISDLQASLDAKIDELAKRVDDVESDTAVKKSADIVSDDAEEDDGEDNIWRGSFLDANSLVKG